LRISGIIFVGLVFESEMAGVDKVKFHVRQIALVRMGSIGGKNLVVLAPDNYRRRLSIAKIGLYGWIQQQVGSIVVEEIHLDIEIAGAIEPRLIVDPIVRRDAG
jgi:hypothetical protein